MFIILNTTSGKRKIFNLDHIAAITEKEEGICTIEYHFRVGSLSDYNKDSTVNVAHSIGEIHKAIGEAIEQV